MAISLIGLRWDVLDGSVDDITFLQTKEVTGLDIPMFWIDHDIGYLSLAECPSVGKPMILPNPNRITKRRMKKSLAEA